MWSRFLVATLFAVSLATAAPAQGAHPIISEDPGTQGTGGVELEVAFAASRGEPGGGRAQQLAVQVAYGLTDTVDLMIVPRYLWLHPAESPRQRGFGDTSLDVKWRFFETDAVQLAVRAGAELTTGDETRDLGAQNTGYHALVAMAVALGPVQWLANVGFARTRVFGERTHQPFASTAVVFPAEGPMRTFVEVAAQANSDPARATWPAVARTGLIWKAGERLDLDVGFEGRLNRAAPRSTFLAGATLRW